MSKARQNNKKTVFIGMSGGVDSSVSAAILKTQGYQVIGVYMKCWNVDGCEERDAEDARRAAESLDIPFYVFDFKEEYKKRVVEYMVEGYKSGITPNPDVECNREIKFGLFYDKAISLGADFIATGHYVENKNGKLFAAKDKNKDQSYFLWTLKPEQIKKCIFPLGKINKPEVRVLAKKFNLHNAEKKDSQGICFLGMVSIEDFLKQYIPEKAGDILNENGEKIGTHKGAYYYTIGQRHGLGVGGSKNPLFVKEKDIKKNIIVLAEGEDNPSLLTSKIIISGINLINKSLKFPLNCFGRVRYRQPLFSCKINKVGDNLEVVFNKPQKFVASGQSFVFYSKSGEMLGGGIIN